MALFIEGIGGTGKAVINLLSFSVLLAQHVGERIPDLSFAVIDQDDQGVWPGVQVWQAVPGVAGQFKDVINLVHPTELSAARLLFSREELETEVSMGFHGHPKLLSTLRHLWSRPQESQLPNHVIIYSDIGGTGAGLGPVRLQQLVSTPGKKNVIGIIFGKYLNQGAVNPTGFRWLHDEVRLPEHAQDRSFTAFYLTVPMLQVPAGVPPQSGLNPTPALLLAVEYLWGLGLADEDGLARILRLNDRAARREYVERADFDTPLFRLGGADSFIKRLRGSAMVNNFAAMLDRSKEYLHYSLTQSIAADHLHQECWWVYAADELRGAGDAPGEDLASAFGETFASVPDPWASARWFHIAAARNVARCREALLRLIVLYLQGDLSVVPTNWTPDGSDRVYALCTEPLRPSDPDFMNRFQNSVVGAFSERYPFWTVPEYESRLKSLEIKSDLSQAALVVARNSPCASALFADDDGAVFEIGNVAAVKGKLPIVVGDALRPSRWDWILEMKASGWDELIQLIQLWPLIGESLSVRYGSAVFEASGGTHECEVAGVRRVITLLPSDGIYIDGTSGLEFYELVLTDRKTDGKQDVSRNRRLVIQDEQGNTGAKQVEVSEVDLLVSNVLTRLTLW